MLHSTERNIQTTLILLKLKIQLHTSRQSLLRYNFQCANVGITSFLSYNQASFYRDWVMEIEKQGCFILGRMRPRDQQKSRYNVILNKLSEYTQDILIFQFDC